MKRKDIIEAIGQAEAYANGEPFESYRDDYLTDAAVVYEILRDKGIVIRGEDDA